VSKINRVRVSRVSCKIRVSSSNPEHDTALARVKILRRSLDSQVLMRSYNMTRTDRNVVSYAAQ